MLGNREATIMYIELQSHSLESFPIDYIQYCLI